MFSRLDISQTPGHQHPHEDEINRDCPGMAVVSSFDTVLKNSCSIVYKKNCSIHNLTVHEEKCSDHSSCDGRETPRTNYKVECQGSRSTICLNISCQFNNLN